MGNTWWRCSRVKQSHVRLGFRHELYDHDRGIKQDSQTCSCRAEAKRDRSMRYVIVCPVRFVADSKHFPLSLGVQSERLATVWESRTADDRTKRFESKRNGYRVALSCPADQQRCL